MVLDRPIFVVGCPRSGTTLLTVMLDRHSELSMTPETAFYDEIAPLMSGGEPEVLRKLLAQWPRLAEMGLTADSVLNRAPDQPSRAQLLGALLASYGARRGKRYSGEKTPQHLWHVSEILNDFPHAHIICMVRDGRDVALSLTAMPWWKKGLEAAALTWLAAHRHRSVCQALYGRRFLSLHYEDLAIEPEQTLRQVMAFVGLAYEPCQLIANQGPSGVVLERSRPWKGHALAPVDPEIGRQRRQTSRSEDLAFLETVLGDALIDAGYVVEADAPMSPAPQRPCLRRPGAAA